MSAKPHGNTDEILLLISVRRQSAFDSMQRIVQGFGLPPHLSPRITELNNYFMNMVFCIELMLKLLSNNWNSHDVGAMYQSAFGKAHVSPGVMNDLKAAIMDQKYLFEPAAGLDGSIPELESLYDELLKELRSKFPDWSINSTVSLPLAFAEYVRDNATRFHQTKSETFGPANPPPADFQDRLMERSHAELEQIRAAFEKHVNDNTTFDFNEHVESLT